MTHIPLQFLTFFANIHAGDELILNKGPGFTNWKMELLELNPPGHALPIPYEIWQSVFVPLAENWQGMIHFYCAELPEGTANCIPSWQVMVKSRPLIDVKMVVRV